ncbi:Bax inhibitor-1/YccA family protein [Cardinium endosymbiont of Culicoides punctatus]|uniref:Bax inhibitor-1/YccA family protein n=1 Tax=Cardinium endosymbiont of Culicoides punctatus TaxID=2304601 RepID=UPI00105906EE|nr:Bax inhibitor-1/YccA family protein [Cardinium endosymbiont of Culicoides punctatus]TDG95726.1 Inner membrane protein YbhL [Cardinium endosymbiont of Culicoides punctatus]
MNDYVKAYGASRKVIDNGLQQYMVKVYAYVACSLLIAAIAAAVTLVFSPLKSLLFTFDIFGNAIGLTMLGYIVLFAPLIISGYLGRNFYSSSIANSRILLAVHAALTGISLSSLAFVYTIDSIHKTFLITAITFGTMSIYGYTTNRDLSSIGSFCRMGLWGLILSSLINIFFGSEVIDFVISFVGVIIFIGFVAYDTQKLKALYYQFQGSNVSEKIAVMGAFSLYLNFLNLFLFLLRFLGQTRRRD